MRQFVAGVKTRLGAAAAAAAGPLLFGTGCSPTYMAHGGGIVRLSLSLALSLRAPTARELTCMQRGVHPPRAQPADGL